MQSLTQSVIHPSNIISLLPLPLLSLVQTLKSLLNIRKLSFIYLFIFILFYFYICSEFCHTLE